MEDQARLLLAALQARSEGRAWCVPNADGFGGGLASPYRKHVSSIMRHHAASATTLAADLEQDIKTHTTVYAALDRAQQEMIAAVREERLELFGHKAKGDGQADPSAIAERVEAVLFLGPRTIDLDGWIREDRQLPIEEWAGYRGPYYDRLHLRTSKVLALWPERAPRESDVSTIPPAGTAAQETSITKWLVSRMTAAPTVPRLKVAMKEAARRAGVDFLAARSSAPGTPPYRRAGRALGPNRGGNRSAVSIRQINRVGFLIRPRSVCSLASCNT